MQRFCYELLTKTVIDRESAQYRDKFRRTFGVFDRTVGMTEGNQIAKCRDPADAERIVRALNAEINAPT